MDTRALNGRQGNRAPVPGTGGPRVTGWPEPQEVRKHAEAALTQVMAAGDIARAIRKLLTTGHSHTGEPGKAARRVIDSARRQHKLTVDVYAVATYAAGLATTGSSDLAALALIELAGLHRRLGYPQDVLWLLHAADTDGVSEPVRRALATVRAVTTQQQGGDHGHG